MTDNRTFISWANYLRDAFNNLKEEGYDFNYIAEMDILTLAHKRDMIYDFYSKHNMSAFEWLANKTLNEKTFHFLQNIKFLDKKKKQKTKY